MIIYATHPASIDDQFGGSECIPIIHLFTISYEFVIRTKENGQGNCINTAVEQSLESQMLRKWQNPAA